ncbi:hypothetical protein CEXT_446491 [Caerostris extrusa]|uniref:Uncharacterized protein n=1 Tax=Caerostris extrusa TaxID=172846 RepID=A0AAV4V0W8_CAEEX|nr:hypothetical protein CEXT_446491 [Caerostris extrusa]
MSLIIDFPDELMSTLKDMPDLTEPENTMMGQKLKEMGVRPARTSCTCVQPPLTVARRRTESAGECCHQLGFIWTPCQHSTCTQMQVVGMLVQLSGVLPTWLGSLLKIFCKTMHY